MTGIHHVPLDTSAAHKTTSSEAAEHPMLVLATTILASSLAFVDSSVVNVSLPAIASALNTDASGLQWTVNAYLLPLSALLLLGGAAGDRFGQRRILILGVGFFALSSIACTFAPTVGWLLAGRFVQGVGAALLMPNSLAILGRTFSGADKGRAIGFWAATGAIAAAIGPVLGGWLVDFATWRAIFLINLPLALAAIALAALYVPHDNRDKVESLDILGGTLATAGLGLITWALTEGSRPTGWTVTSRAGLCAGGALLLSFVFSEKMRGERAMMPLQLFGSRTFVGLTLLTLLLYGALGGLMVLLPYVLIEACDYTGTQAGAALLPLPIILALMSPLAGSLSARIGARWLLTIGSMLVAFGFLTALHIGSGENYWLNVFPTIAIVALGMAGAVAPLTTAVLSSVDPRHVGSASGFNSAVARTGGLIATALIGSVLAEKGPSLLSAFGTTALAGAAACAVAGLSALILIRN